MGSTGDSRGGTAAVVGWLLLCLAFVLPAQALELHGNVPVLNYEDVRAGYSLDGAWLFQPGDDMRWASPDFDDSRWGSINKVGIA